MTNRQKGTRPPRQKSAAHRPREGAPPPRERRTKPAPRDDIVAGRHAVAAVLAGQPADFTPAVTAATGPNTAAARCGQRCQMHIAQGASPPRY